MMTQITLPPQNYSPVFPAEVKKELRVYEIKKRTGRPFFLASMFIPEMLWTTRIYNLDMVLDKFVTMEAGNSTRVFLFPSSWDAKYNRWATDIFLTDINGEFIMPYPDRADLVMWKCINPEWEAQVINRIKKVVRRKIMLIVSLWDNCSFHQRSPGFWKENFLNPWNNNISTSNDNHAYYLYATDTSAQMQNTGKIVEALTRYMLNRIHESLTIDERKYIAIETCNEGQSGTAWHLEMKEIINETWGQDCPRWRRFTSTEGKAPLSMGKNFTPVTHQIGDMQSYLDRALNPLKSACVWYSHGISTDGWHEPGDVPIPLARARKLLKRAHADGHVLFELLNGHRQTDDIRLPGATRNTMPDKYYYDFSAMRWKEMRELAKLLMRLTRGEKQ